MILYAVYWPDAHVFKVGVASHMGRVRKHLKRGAQPWLLARGRDRRDEQRALDGLAGLFPRAFKTWHESRSLLGENGSGYLECFTVKPGEVDKAFRRVCVGLIRG